MSPLIIFFDSDLLQLWFRLFFVISLLIEAKRDYFDEVFGNNTEGIVHVS